MYRPQFAYRTPKGTEDHRCHFSFDATNTPFLVGNLGSGLATGRIPLLMDSDAEFYIRGIQIQDRSLVFPFPSSGLQIRLESCYGDPLSDSGNSPVVAGTQRNNYVDPALFGECDGAGIVALESDDCIGKSATHCPAGGALSLYVLNPTAAPISLANIIINLHGVKRYSGEKCA